MIKEVIQVYIPKHCDDKEILKEKSNSSSGKNQEDNYSEDSGYSFYNIARHNLDTWSGSTVQEKTMPEEIL